MFRLIRITESVEKDDKVDKLIDSVLRIYKNELNDDEVVRLVSNLRKQANEIIRQRKNVDVMINNSETNDGQEDDVDIHDWEDQVTTNKSPVTDDAEIKSADKVSHPDPSSDEIEDDEDTEEDSDTDEESEEPIEDDSDESESEESEPEDEPESDNSDESVDSSEDEGPKDRPKDIPEDIPEEGKKSKDKKVKKKPEEEEKSDTEGKEKSKSIKKEGFRLIRIS